MAQFRSWWLDLKRSLVLGWVGNKRERHTECALRATQKRAGRVRALLSQLVHCAFQTVVSISSLAFRNVAGFNLNDCYSPEQHSWFSGLWSHEKNNQRSFVKDWTCFLKMEGSNNTSGDVTIWRCLVGVLSSAFVWCWLDKLALKLRQEIECVASNFVPHFWLTASQFKEAEAMRGKSFPISDQNLTLDSRQGLKKSALSAKPKNRANWKKISHVGEM